MTRWQKSLLFVGVGLIIFSAARVALLFVYPDFFSPLSARQVFLSFLNGVRFDLSITLTAFSLFLLLFNLPVRAANARIWQGVWGWLIYCVVIILSLLLIGDVIYFADVKRHMTTEIFLLGNDADFILTMVISNYKTVFLVFLALAVIIGAMWRRIINLPTKQSALMPLKFFGFILFMVMGVRGTFSDKPINIIDAFETGSSVQSNLVLNGAFTLYHYARASKNTINHRFFIPEEAQRIARIPLENHPDSIIDPQSSPGAPKSNVVFMVLESWGQYYVDSFANNGFGVTPNLDRLANGGLKFANFYAVGQRSIEGIQAALSGLPPIIGLPTLAFGLEANEFSRIGNVLSSNGYETIFIQSSKRRSYRMDAVARATGFESYYGMEDMPMLLDYSGQKAAFGWDYESMMFLKSKIDAAREPFFGFLFTGTTHTPYINPGNWLEKFPHGPYSKEGFLNTLYYSDWSLGRFMEAAARSPWFDNTIFIFTADHALGDFHNSDYPGQFHIPLVIYAPKLFKHQTINVVGSHLDIAPTVLDLLGINKGIATIGTSLFKKNDEFAYLCDKNSVGIISPHGYLRHTLGNRLEAGTFREMEGRDAYLDRLEKKLLALDQTMYDLITSNRWEEINRH